MENEGLGTNDPSLGAKNDISVGFQRMVYCEAARMLLLHKQWHSWRCCTVGSHANSKHQEQFLTSGCAPT